MSNPYGWHLPLTDSMIYEESPYAPLDSPAENIAERLVMLAHLSFDPNVWGPQTGRGLRYWAAFGEHIEGATNNPDVASWWCAVMAGLPGQPFRSVDLIHEKNLLCHPTHLPVTPVDDVEVLSVIRTYMIDLRDRTRMWVKIRRGIRSAAAEAIRKADAERVDDDRSDD